MAGFMMVEYHLSWRDFLMMEPALTNALYAAACERRGLVSQQNYRFREIADAAKRGEPTPGIVMWRDLKKTTES